MALLDLAAPAPLKTNGLKKIGTRTLMAETVRYRIAAICHDYRLKRLEFQLAAPVAPCFTVQT